MFTKKIIVLLIFALIFLSACAGGEYSPNHETAPSDNGMPDSRDNLDDDMPDQEEYSMDMLWSLVGTVSVVSDGVEHEPYIRFEHAGITSSEGQASGSPPAPPSIEEFLEMLPKIQYSDDFQVIVDGEYANKITYSLSEIEDFKQSYSGGPVPAETEELNIPETEGTYILVVRVIWSDSDSHANYVFNSYTSTIIVESDFSAHDDIRDLVYAELVVDGLILGDEEVFRSFGLDDADSLSWIEDTFGSAMEIGSVNDADRPGCPFWATLYITRSDGMTIEILPATDDCKTFIFNENYYMWGSGTNGAFYELFGASSFDSLLSME